MVEAAVALEAEVAAVDMVAEEVTGVEEVMTKARRQRLSKSEPSLTPARERPCASSRSKTKSRTSTGTSSWRTKRKSEKLRKSLDPLTRRPLR